MKHNAFAPIYHAHHTRQSEDIPFWLALAGQHPGRVLELGTGTGRVLLPLLQAGYPSIGLDHDHSMLVELQANAAKSQPSDIRLVQADMGTFHFGCRFELIILPCNTLSTLEPGLRRQMLHTVKKHLLPGGCFAASSPNPHVFQDLPALGEPEIEDVFPHPYDGEPVQVSSEWKRTKSHFTLTWHYDHLQPDGKVHRYSAVAQHDLAPAQTYLDELDSAGLSLTALYGDFDHSEFNSESPHMIMVTATQA